MKGDFSALQAKIGCTNIWLADMLGIAPEHVSRLRSGKVKMSRPIELAMLALASGWRP